MSTEELMKRVEEDDRWDSGVLGRDMKHAKEASLTLEDAEKLSAAAGLQMISIRLPKPLIDDFRFIADTQGLRYQTLMRQALARFAECEIKQMARQAASEQMASIKLEESGRDRKTG